MSAKLRWAVRHGVFVVVATDGCVVDEEWYPMIEDLRKSSVSSFLCLIVGSTMATPSQRRPMFDLLKAKQLPSMVVTNSPVTRGLVTAAAWFGVKARAYATHDIDRAVHDLGLSGDDGVEVSRALLKMRDTVVRRANDAHGIAS